MIKHHAQILISSYSLKLLNLFLSCHKTLTQSLQKFWFLKLKSKLNKMIKTWFEFCHFCKGTLFLIFSKIMMQYFPVSLCLFQWKYQTKIHFVQFSSRHKLTPTCPTCVYITWWGLAAWTTALTSSSAPDTAFFWGNDQGFVEAATSFLPSDPSLAKTSSVIILQGETRQVALFQWTLNIPCSTHTHGHRHPACWKTQQWATFVFLHHLFGPWCQQQHSGGGSC